jgi:hypothetical protein
MDQRLSGLASTQCHVERIERNLSTDTTIHRPTDNPTRVQVHHHRQV